MKSFIIQGAKLNLSVEMTSAEVISCSKSITIHSLQSRQPLFNFTHHRGIVNCVNINHNNKVIASCGQDGKIFLVNAEKPENKLMEHNFYPNAKEKPSSLSVCAFSHNSKFLAVGSVDSVVKLWDLRGDKSQKDQSIMQIKSHMGAISSLAWIKSLKGQAYGSEILASASASGDIYIHSNKNGEFNQTNFMKMQEGINCIRVSQGNDFCRLAACTNGGTLALWDLAANRQKPYWSISPTQNKASMSSLSFSPFTPILMVTSGVDQNLMFYDILEKKLVKKIVAEEPLSTVGLHRNGQMLVAGGMYGSIFVYDLRYPNKTQCKLLGHQTSIKHLEFCKQKQKQIVESKGVKSISNVNPLVSNSNQNIEVKNLPSQQQMKKQPTKPPEPIVNNFINIQKPSMIQQKARQNTGLQSKISKASQQFPKHSLPKSQLPQFKQSAEGDFYRNRSKQPYNPLSNSDMSQKSDNLRKEVKELKDMIVSLKGGQQDLKRELYDMQERISLSMIKQFQLHQLEMTKIMEGLLNRESEKDRLIKKLEQENKKLKSTTF